MTNQRPTQDQIESIEKRLKASETTTLQLLVDVRRLQLGIKPPPESFREVFPDFPTTATPL